MAISRAQLLKELLPGLNALFGLEYQKYEDEHAEIYAAISSRDQERAVQAMNRHLMQVQNTIEGYYQKTEKLA